MTEPFDRTLPSPIAAVLAMRSAAADSVAIAGHLSERQQRVAVPTPVEQAILDAVARGGLQLLVISGSAGDGKSFTIANLLDAPANPWKGYPERVIEDATHSERPGQDQLERLEQFLKPLAVGEIPLEGPPLLIAMNTGMVIRFFTDLRKRSEARWARLAPLAEVLMTRLRVPHEQWAEPAAAFAASILVANLDDRPTTGGPDSLFSGILSTLDPDDPSGVMGGAHRCGTCQVRDWCWVRTNAELLSSDPPRAAVDELADRVALERGRSIPPRALWDLAALLATGGATFSGTDPCESIAALAAEPRATAIRQVWERVLPNGLFSDTSLHDDLPAQLRDQDPTFVAGARWHERIASAGIEVAEDARYLARNLLARPDGGHEALRTVIAALATGELAEAVGPGWRASVCRSLARASFLAGEIDAQSPDLADFRELLDEYDSGALGARILEFEEVAGVALARSFGEQIRSETFFQARQRADGDVAVQVRVDVEPGKTHDVAEDPVRRSNPVGAAVTGYRPLSLQLQVHTGGNSSDEITVTLPLYRLLREAERSVLPSAADLERFFSLRRAAAALGDRAARDRRQPILLSDRRVGRRVRLERQERRGSMRYREQEVT